MTARPLDLRVYLVTDPGLMPWDRFTETIHQLVAQGGVRAVQLRDKSGDARRLVDVGQALRRILARSGVRLIVNDRIDVALAAGADGVHLGQSDVPVAHARRILGPDAIIGVSIEQVDQADLVDGASYVAASPVYATRTKTDTQTPLGLEGVAAIRARTHLPLVAIGGIDAHRADAVIRAGADGVAIVSAVLGAPDPVRACEQIALAVDAARARPGRVFNALTIAGSDSGGGAGVQADLKTFSALGVYGCSVLTALTAQNTHTVTAIHDVPPDFVTAQLDAVFDDIDVHAVKIGMLSAVPTIEAVARFLKSRTPTNVVLDPVMVAKGGARLLDPDAVHALRAQLVPLAAVITPNLPEAGVLLDRPAPKTLAEMEAAARQLSQLGPAALVKGGHLEGHQSVDVLAHGERMQSFASRRIASQNTHGTGCTLSSAIAAHLAAGHDILGAVEAAKRYVVGAIASSANLAVGSGHGPVHHFHRYWPSSFE